MKRLAICIAAFALMVLPCSCKKDSPPPATGPSLIQLPAQKPQFQIPWPGLANSAWPMRLHDPQHTCRSSYSGPQEGKIEWRFDAAKEVFSSPAIDEDGTVIFGNFGSALFAVLPAGTAKWQVPFVPSDGSYLISSDGSIYTVDAYLNLCSFDRNGNLNWKYLVGPATLRAPSTPTISYDGQTVFVASGWLYAVDKNGNLRWKAKPDSTINLDGSPAISPDGSVIYASSSVGLYAIDTSGAFKWKFPQQCSDASIDNDGNIYVGISEFQVCSLDPSGSVRWTTGNIEWGGQPWLTVPAIGPDGTIYVTGFMGVFALDYAGNLKWSYPMPHDANIASAPAIDNHGMVYVGWCTPRTAVDTINFVAIDSLGTLKYKLGLKNPDGTVPDIDSDPSISADRKLYVGCDRPYGRYLFKVK